jgi:biopolymer transport protein ExbB/TolQ
MTAFYGIVAALGLTGLVLTGWIMLALRRESILSRRIILDVPDMVRRGRRADALALCSRHPSALATVWHAALAHAARAPAWRPADLEETMDGEVLRATMRIQARASYLLDIGSGAMLTGLFVAVCGVATTLAPVGFNSLVASAELLRDAICRAVAATGMGVGVCVVAQAGYAVYRGFGAPALDELGDRSREMIALLAPNEATQRGNTGRS